MGVLPTCSSSASRNRTPSDLKHICLMFSSAVRPGSISSRYLGTPPVTDNTLSLSPASMPYRCEALRDGAMGRAGQGGNLGLWIEQASILVERPHDTKSSCPPAGSRILGQPRPAYGQLDRDGASMTDAVGVPGESYQLLTAALQREAKPSPEREVVLSQGHHRHGLRGRRLRDLPGRMLGGRSLTRRRR